MIFLPPVLVIDDDLNDRNLLSLVIRGAFGDATIDVASDSISLTRALGSRPYGLIVTEIDLPWISGPQLMDLLREHQPEAAVVVVTRSADPVSFSAALKSGADGFLTKDPTGLTTIEEVIRTALFWSRKKRSHEEAPAPGLVDRLPVGIFTTDERGVFLDANQAMATMLGFDRPAEMSHRPLVHCVADPTTAQRLEAAISARAPAIAIDALLERHDGSRFWARMRLRPAPPTAGVPPRIHGVAEDLGDYRKALGQLDIRTREHEQSVRDLEELGYVVSHDLQQPLNGLLRALDQINTGKDAPAAEPVIMARRNAAAIDRMLASILRLTNLEKQGLELGPVDLNRVVGRVLDLLESDIERVDAAVAVDPLPTITADEGQMEQLFQNLISNALKYCGDRPPKVHIGASREAGEWCLQVIDKGIGIDPSATERIFAMFQRLHTQEEIPGTGIGLAVCRRIAARHGGAISVSSRPGEGSTFTITIPDEENPKP